MSLNISFFLLELNIYGRKTNLTVTPVTWKSGCTSHVGGQPCCSFYVTCLAFLLSQRITSPLTSNPHTHSLWHYTVSQWPWFTHQWNTVTSRECCSHPRIYSVDCTYTDILCLNLLSPTGAPPFLYGPDLWCTVSPPFCRLLGTNISESSHIVSVFQYLPVSSINHTNTFYCYICFQLYTLYIVGKCCWFLNVPDVEESDGLFLIFEPKRFTSTSVKSFSVWYIRNHHYFPAETSMVPSKSWL